MKNIEKTKEQLLNENDQLKNKIAKLEKSELKSQIWLENLPVCTKIVDLDFNLQYMSASGIRELKIDDINAYYGKPYPLDFFPDSFKIPMASNLKKVKETGKTIIQEAPIVDVEGNELWYHSTIAPVNDDKGKLDYFMVVSLETTVRKKAQDEIQKTNSLLKSIINSPDNIIMFALDTNYNYLSFNEAHVKEMKLIYDADIEVGKHIIDYIHYDDDQAKVKINYKRVLKGERFTQIQQYGIDKDRTWYELIFNPIYDDLNRVTGFTVFVTNITERKQAEEELQLTQISVDKLTDAVYWMGPDAKFIYVNDQAVKELGYTKEELLTMTVHDIGPEFPVEVWPQHWAELKDKGSFVINTFHQRKDKSIFPVEITLNYIQFGDKEINCAIAKDITERKQTEKSLEEISKLNTMILDTAGEGIYGLDLEGNTTFVNPAAVKMIGWEVKDILGKGQHDLLHHTKSDGTIYNKKDCPIYAAYKDGQVHEIVDEVFWRKDGSSFPVEYISTPIRNEQGELAGAVVSFRDITKRKQIEEELINHRENLEKMIDERTIELKEQNKKLDSAMKVFVGREIKIRDLEKRLRAFEGG